MTNTRHDMPLNEQEFDTLGAFLGRFPQALSLESMDGLFCALICAPRVPPMHDVVEAVFGEDPSFADEAEAREIMGLMIRHWNAISEALSGAEPYFPILAEDESGKTSANDWAKGFYLGMGFDREGWAMLLHDEEQSGWIFPVLMLVHEHDPDPALRPGLIDDERRENVIGLLIAGLEKIYDYFAPHRRAAAAAAVSTFRRRRPKVGRNDPCPCGSGRKYKQCCGGDKPPEV